MKRKRAILLAMFLCFGLVCVPTATAHDINEHESIPPEIFQLHHILTSQELKNLITATQPKVDKMDKYLEEMRKLKELIVIRTGKENKSWDRLPNSMICINHGQDLPNGIEGGCLGAEWDQSKGTLFISPECSAFLDYSPHIKHGLNTTQLLNYWQKELDLLWNNSEQYLAGTIFEGKKIKTWYVDIDTTNTTRMILIPTYLDKRGHKWEIILGLETRKLPEIEEGNCINYNLGEYTYRCGIKVIHEKHSRTFDEDALDGPIVYYY